MYTKSQDVVVALILALGGSELTYAELARALGMSASEVHAAVRRLTDARLLEPDSRRVRLGALRNFIVHGVPYAFPARPEAMTRGMPTAWAAPIMSGKIAAADQPLPVWPDPDGKVQGVAVEPLYSSVPGAARRNQELYDLLALVDVLRIGRARERTMAEKEINHRLNHHAHA